MHKSKITIQSDARDKAVKRLVRAAALLTPMYPQEIMDMDKRHAMALQEVGLAVMIDLPAADPDERGLDILTGWLKQHKEVDHDNQEHR